MYRAPTLNPGPCLVFLDPAKKGLRYPNLKSKSSLLLQYSTLVSHKKSLSHQSCSSSLLITSTVCQSAQHCCNSLLNLLCSSSAGQHYSSLLVNLCCWSSSTLLIISAQHTSTLLVQNCWPINSSIVAHTDHLLYCSKIILIQQRSAHHLVSHLCCLSIIINRENQGMHMSLRFLDYQ